MKKNLTLPSLRTITAIFVLLFILIVIKELNTTEKNNITITPTTVESTEYDSTEYTKILNDIDTINPDNIYIGHIISLKDLRSKVLYKKNCKFCHGESGKGDGIKSRVNPDICPYDLTKETKSDKFVYYVILNGKNYMPPHSKLNDDNINLLIIYIKKKL